MLRIVRVLTILVPMIFATTVAAEDFHVGTVNPGHPELNLLRRFEGKWRAELANSNEAITSERKWILNGTFLEHDFQLSNGSVNGKILRGYNTESKEYSMTVFDSSGNVALLHGYWDADLKTMIYDTDSSSSLIQKYESYFPDAKTEKWTITLKSGGQISGTAKKQDQ